MGWRGLLGVLALAVLGTGIAPAADTATETGEVLAGPPSDLSVTVYRAPDRESGSMELNDLRGFALIRETRVVNLPAGLSRVRFEGVTDGIEPVSALVTGLRHGVLEKNLDAELLSPATLVAAAAGKPLVLLRANKATGRTERISGTIVSGGNAEGIVFKTADGTEALRCSGLPETFYFTDAHGLSASPTLSVLVRASEPTIERVQLSYLAYGFDWAADYTAMLSADGNALNLGAWVTLANGNGMSFPNAHTQIVAGRLNRETQLDLPEAEGGPMLARCWPQGSTSDRVAPMNIARAVPLGFENILRSRAYMMAASPMAIANADIEEVTVAGSRVRQEQLGDLKLYRVPERTTVASHQSKQVRLLDRSAIPVHRVYAATRIEDDLNDDGWVPANVLLRTRNDAANRLGLPLPSGRVAVFTTGRGARLLLNETNFKDHALDEDVEIEAGQSSDVQVRSSDIGRDLDLASFRAIPFLPGFATLAISRIETVSQVEVSNAGSQSVDFELTVQLNGDAQLAKATHPLGRKNGRPIFRMTIPAHHKVTLRYVTAHRVQRLVRPP